MDLKHRTWPEAVELAKSASGKTNPEIAKGMTLALGRDKPFPETSVAGWFTLDRDYWPSCSIIPHLCRVLGNTILVDWMIEQLRDLPPCTVPATPGTILAVLPGLMARFGDIGEGLVAAVDDGRITPREAREIIGDVVQLRGRLDTLEGLLAPLAEQAKRRA